MMSTVGLPCPGCGMTRAFFCLLHLDIKSAFYYHPLFWFVPVYAGLAVFKRIKYGKKETKWFVVFTWASFILFMGVYFVRMILYFPHTEPFVLNPDSFTQRLVYFIIHLVEKLGV